MPRALKPLGARDVVLHVSLDMARVYLHAGAPPPSKLSPIAFGFRISNSNYYSLNLPVAKAAGDAPVESASRSPRIDSTVSYQLNWSVKVPRPD